MLSSPRFLSISLSFIITAISLLFVSYLPSMQILHYLVIGGVISLSSATIFYLSFDILIVNQINTIFQSLQTDSSLDYINHNKIIRSSNPIKKLKKEIDDYIFTKEEELHKLKDIEHYRKEFIANISHEFKTPLFTASGYISTLLDGAKDDPKVAEKFLQKASDSLENLNSLVEDILTLSKADEGTYTLKLEDVNLLELVEKVKDKHEYLAQNKGIRIELDIAKEPELYTKADPTILDQIISNLLSNGIKYGKLDGSVKIKIKSQEKFWEISVTDNGIGIHKDDLDRIFERFYRVDKSRSRVSGRTGLGLSIVKHFLYLHGSQIRVKSILGKGSKFSFLLEKSHQTS
ncbi:MAG: sensor histidine kinase [Leadbetterella sp.]